MNEKVVKLGVVGLIRGLSVVSDVVGCPEVRLTAVCDMQQERIDNAIEKLGTLGVSGLQCYTDFEEMLRDAEVDAVYIATYATYHVPYVVQALDAGKHVISEIPAINSLEEARELKAAVLRHPELKYMVGENCCYWAFIQTWKQMYDEGKLGETIYAESEYIHSRDWREMRPEDYPAEHWRFFNPAIKYLTHNLGPLLYIMDDYCVSASCMVPEVKYNPYRKDKNAVAIFRTAKGAVIRILICFDAFVGFDHNFSIIGTRGSIETDKTKPLDDAHSFARFSDVSGSIHEKVEIPVALQLPGESSRGHGGADGKMMKAFIKCILEDTTPPLDVDFAIRISLPGIIASESALEGGTLKEIPVIE
ncbi:MAG: Gfo/Idh/MocA family oxidoreductase [Clostridia bacterium]|nr:Gfo/Idh/MocA family oxidoreductase [Clostridia bacterium]